MIKKLADRFFRWFCRPEYYADIRGDLEEMYQEYLEEHPRKKADWHYTIEVLLLLRLSLIRRPKITYPKFYPAMLQHNVKIALRQLVRQKMYAFIKIAGLAISVAACIMLALYVQHELSYDRHLAKAEQSYRVTIVFEKEARAGASLPPPFARTIVRDFPVIEKAARYIDASWINLLRPQGSDRNAFEKGFAYVDQSLLEIMEIRLISGNPTEALNRPQSIVISQSKAEKHFPNQDPLGKAIIINDDTEHPYQITGVMEDFPSNSHLDFDFLLTLKGVEFWPGEQDNWGLNMYNTYAQLRKGADPKKLEGDLSDVISSYLLPNWREREFSDPEAIANNMSFKLQAVQDIYLNSEQVGDKLQHGDIRLIWLFGIAAVLILLIASVNFINLSTARANKRSKEIGMRKVIGAQKKQLTLQYMTESVVFSLLSFVLGLMIAWLLLPAFNDFTGKSFQLPWTDYRFPLLLILGSVALGIVSGIYPAFILSSFKPLNVLKGKSDTGSPSPIFRNLLVGFQFAISIILIICTIITYQQMQFILDKDLGFDKDQVLMVQGTQALGDKQKTFKAEAEQLAFVKHATVTSYLPVAEMARYANSFWHLGKESLEEGVTAQIWEVDADYLPTMGLTLSNGRNFDTNISGDAQAMIINESMARQLGISQAQNQPLTEKEKTWNVIGIIEDFHFESLKENIGPLCLVLGESQGVISLKISSSDIPQAISEIESLWTRLAPQQAFQFSFLDENYASMYDDVQRAGLLFNGFSLLAILIACMGLFGLTAYIAQQRSKELGIRKILGAKTQQLVGLLASEFIFLALISIVIASPIAWLVMNEWLSSFAYHIEVQFWVFLFAGSLTLLIACITISYHCLNAALAQPVDTIRNE